MRKLVCTLAGAMLMSACAYSGVKEVERADFTGAGYNQMLAAEYKNYAMFEANEMADWRDAEYFAEKALMAGEGQKVMPTAMAERHIPSFAMSELSGARADLVNALNILKTEDNLPHLAKAQASFDCWMEQQEENVQPTHISDCRKHFNDAMSKLVKPHVYVEETYRVFFEHDSAEITDQAMSTIMDAKMFIGGMVGSSIVLTGNADTTGKSEYNKKLSEERAKAVYDAMMSAQIPEHKVKIMAEGEENLMVQTDDGVREPQNRRVDVLIVR